MIVDIHGCARCGWDHSALRFTPFFRAVETEPLLTHWAICPTTNEPLLQCVYEVAEAHAPIDHEIHAWENEGGAVHG